MKKFSLLIFTIFIHFSLFATTRYVNINVAGGLNNGLSWTNAYTNLQNAIDAANIGDEIWIAKGTYLPMDAPDGTTSTGLTDRNNAFHFHTNIEIYGGFSGNGTETQLSQRNAVTNITILSGDFNGNDVVTGSGSTLSITLNTENAYHVIIMANLTSAAVIDGITFRGGNADDSGDITYQAEKFIKGAGGGMLNRNSSPTITNSIFTNNSGNLGSGMFNVSSSSPTITSSTFDNNNANFGGGMYNHTSSPMITSCSFTNNIAASNGGGMLNTSSSPTVTNSTFLNNTATINGGGVYNTGSSPMITGSNFNNNNADLGGGLFNTSSSAPTITSSTFDNNTASGDGGGMYNTNASASIITNSNFTNNTGTRGGGLYNHTSSPTVTNSTFINNTATFNGGGILNFSSSPTITNSIFINNSATNIGGAMFNHTSSPVIINTIFWDNLQNGSNNAAGSDISNNNSTPIITYSLTQENSNYNSGTGIINNQNPLFVDAANGDYRLQTGSPAINTGDDVSGSSANTTTLDLAGNARFDGVIDMGAYEGGFASLPVELLYFKGQNIEDGHLLIWKTASELNNKGFEIQQSKDGIEWETLDFVQGNGTTLEISNYEYLDENPFGNINYYRLKQIDFDGQFEYSKIVIINYELSINNYQLKIYPNPVSDILNIENGQGQAVIYNMLGQPIREWTIDNEQLTISVSDLPKSQYILHIRKQNGEVVTKRFVK